MVTCYQQLLWDVSICHILLFIFMSKSFSAIHTHKNNNKKNTRNTNTKQNQNPQNPNILKNPPLVAEFPPRLGSKHVTLMMSKLRSA